jgi:hypothetical protein
MRHNLEYGRRYRGKVIIGPLFKRLITQQEISETLRKYQLAGTVTEIHEGYQFEGVFRGRSGTYDLPEPVRDVEYLG